VKQTVDLIPENMYGHAKRLQWVIDHLRDGQTIVEWGCGTGVMISFPLLKMNYSVYGLDLDGSSIQYGQALLRQEGLDPERLQVSEISQFEVAPDVIIASEVLEHLPDKDLPSALSRLRSKLKRGGTLLITVPNGRGWFEWESFLWHRTGIGPFLVRSRIAGLMSRLKAQMLRRNPEPLYPSTLATSQHCQRFTYSSIQELLRENGFEVIDIRGSVLFAGPFCNLCFTGFKWVMEINGFLGARFPKVASGFYLACRPA